MKQKDGNNKRTLERGHPAAPQSAGPPPQGETPATTSPTPLTPEQIQSLQDRAAKADEHWDRLLRTTADFENFKKRAARERQDGINYANETLLQKLIPILDSLDLAEATTQNPQADSAQSLQAGIAMTAQQLKRVLIGTGLEEIDARGKPFDPRVHEAVSQQENAEVPEGTVVQQLRKGYQLRGRLLRPAAVVIAKPTAASDPGTAPAT